MQEEPGAKLVNSAEAILKISENPEENLDVNPNSENYYKVFAINKLF